MSSVAIVGASNDRTKYGNKAVRAYKNKGWTIYPVNPNEEQVEGLKAYDSIREIPEKVDRVAFYVPSKVGVEVLDQFVDGMRPEVFFNPGTESEELLAKARELGLNFRTACAIVDIGESPSRY